MAGLTPVWWLAEGPTGSTGELKSPKLELGGMPAGGDVTAPAAWKSANPSFSETREFDNYLIMHNVC